MKTISRRIAGAAMILTSPLAAFADGGEAAGAWPALASLVLPLLLITAAAGAATFVLTRWKGSVVRRDGPLQLVQILPLGPRERLVLVRAGSRQLVLGVTASGITAVAELSPADRAAAAASATGGNAGENSAAAAADTTSARLPLP